MPPILRWLLALGPTNPIAVRLVQNGSKRTRHMYVRSGYLAVLIVVLLWALIFNTREGDLSYLELARAGASSMTVRLKSRCNASWRCWWRGCRSLR